MATDVPFGKKARITWRFKRGDGSDAKVDGVPTLKDILPDELKQNEDGSWTALVGMGGGATGPLSVVVVADVDLGPDAKSVEFPLADLNFLAEGQAETVSDVVVAVE